MVRVCCICVRWEVVKAQGAKDWVGGITVEIRGVSRFRFTDGKVGNKIVGKFTGKMEGKIGDKLVNKMGGKFEGGVKGKVEGKVGCNKVYGKP